MIIEVAVDEPVCFGFEPGNFPYTYTFLDRTTGCLVRIKMEKDTLINLLNDMTNEINKHDKL